MSLSSTELWNYFFFALVVGVALFRIVWRATRHSSELPRANWEGAVKFGVEVPHRPTTVPELAQLLAEANRERRQVKVVGAGHSWSSIARPDSSATLFLSLNHIAGLVDVDEQRRRLTFGAGTRLVDAIALAKRVGLMFENLPSVSDQSLAGLLATATHGTGLGVGNLASMCRRVSLLDAAGDVHTFEHGVDDEFAGAVVHLGALGVLIEVTFELVPLQNVHERTSVVPLDALLAELDGTLGGAKHVKFWADLASNKAILYRSVPTGEQPRNNVARWLLDARAYAFAALQLASSFVPGAANAVLALVIDSWPVIDRVSSAEAVFVIPHAVPRHAELEYAFPAEHCVAVLREFRATLRQTGLEIGHIVEVRFVAADRLWMSPNYDMAACHVTLLSQFRGSGDTRRYFALFERHLIERFGGKARAHWGKTFFEFAHQRSAYPMFGQWNRLRERLDPNGIFRNEFLNDLLA